MTRSRPVSDAQVLADSQALLANPLHGENPLRPALAELLALCIKQQQRLEKITRISDRYHESLRVTSAELEEAAMTDALTGLRNRRYLMEQLKKESLRSERQAEPFALAIVDVDFFKSINDRFGHEAGDVALFQVAQSIRSGLREYDICGRWGGEEFLILLPNTSLANAQLVLERVRKAIANISLDCLDQEQAPQLTASMGLTLHQPGESCSSTVDRADLALYRAKSSGRNRIETS